VLPDPERHSPVRRTSAVIATFGVVAALALCACSADTSRPPAGAPSRSAVDTAACGLPDASGTGAPSGSPAPVRAKGRVGVILPRASSTTASPHAAALLARTLERAGLSPDIRHAPMGDHASVSIARRLIREGVKLLILESVDTASGIKVEHAAELAGVPVIDYQHLNPGGSARYLVSFDYEEIGRLQATAMIECLDARGITHPRIIVMDGGTDVDENAVLLAIGAHQVLDPLVNAGKADIEQEATVKGWQSGRAAAVFTQALNSSDGQVDAVLGGGERGGAAVVRGVGGRGLERAIVSGQGFGTDDLPNVVAGRQSATVVTDPRQEADAAAELAAAVVSGSARALAGLPLSTFDDPVAPGHQLSSLLLPGLLVTRTNVADVSGAGALRTSPSP
jgi:D-xylose transport system substrate-binding protein